MTMGTATTTQWWLAVVGDHLMWARLRELESGTAEILDNDGRLLVYDSLDTARAALMDADYRELDGLDADDATGMGLDLATLAPPAADDEAALARLMTQRLVAR
jgi:hypothetical protein